MNPPHHAAVRRELLGAWPIAAKARQSRPRTRHIIRTTIRAEVERDGPVGALATLGPLLAVRTFADFVGVPAEIWEQQLAGRRRAASAAPSPAATHALETDLGLLVRARRADCALSQILETVRAASGRRMTERDVAKLVLVLELAAIETNAKAITEVLWATVTPRASPSAAHDVVERVIAERPPVEVIRRLAAGAGALGSCATHPGTLVEVDVAQANSSARRRLTAAPRASHHLSFGYGPHYCPGAPFARMMLGEVVDVVRSDVPDLRAAASTRPAERD
jgi:cytochrome P450